MLVLLLNNFVKKPRRSSAMPAFFASLPNKITSPNSENLFRNKPLSSVHNKSILFFLSIKKQNGYPALFANQSILFF